MALPNRPPPLQWLPVFEAIARHLSVRKAAEELHVTPSALSQQLKSLEDYLGIKLLHRMGKGVALTEAGSYYLPLVQEILAAQDRAYRQLKSRFDRSELRISMDPLVANELIIPRLREFSELHPEINLRVETSMHNIDFEKETAHAAIRFADHIAKGLHGELIHECAINLLVAPAAFKALPIANLSDLEHHAWITYSPSANEWDMLFLFLDIKRPKNQGVIHFDNVISAVTAVEQGLGVMIGLFPSMKRLVDSGRIMAVYEEPIAIPMAHFLVCREADKDREDIQLFARWCRDIFAKA